LGLREASVQGDSRPTTIDGETRNRTGDTTIFSRVLYQLSYLAEQLSDGSGAYTRQGYAMTFMEAALEHHHHDHGDAGWSVALSATLHCLTGCAIGEVLGMVIGTAVGFSSWGTVALSVALAFVFGYSLTSLPLLRAGFAIAAVVPIALASDTLSIAVMEVVDNALMLVIPGAIDAGVGDVLFWGSLSVALVVAGAAALPLNFWLIGRGRGHAVVHETGVHGGPSPRLVGAIATVAGLFGTVVLVSEALS
jgi:hypothetical protein